MSFVSEWLETAQNVVRTPADHFKSERRRDGFDYPLKFALFAYLLAAIIGALRNGIYATGGAGNPLTAFVSTFIMTPIAGVIGLLIIAGLVHIAVYLMGGRDYSRTFAALAYTTALAPISALLAFVPILGGLIGFLVWVYGLYIAIKAVEEFQNLSTGQAAIAVLLPVVILGLIAAALFAVLAVFFITASTVVGP